MFKENKWIWRKQRFSLTPKESLGVICLRNNSLTDGRQTYKWTFDCFSFCANRKISPNYAFRHWTVDAKQKETVGFGAHINRIQTLFIIRKSEYFATVEFYYLCFLFEQCRNRAAEALEVFVVGWKKSSENRNSDSLRFCNLSA